MRFTADTTGIRIDGDHGPLLASPTAGLWSVAMEWQDGWPADWYHALPQRVAAAGPWTLLEGAVHTPRGDWLIQDAWRPDGDGVWHCIRTWRWTGSASATRCALTVRFHAGAAGRRVLVPGCLYYGNPSGARSGRTPVFAGTPGERAFYEEHRLPMPFVTAEIPAGDTVTGVALHSLPSPAHCGHRPDQWWSIGVEAGPHGTELALLSGPCAANGRNSTIKAFQDRWVPYDEAWLEVPSGTVIRKEFAVEVVAGLRRGDGFRPAVRTCLRRLAPFGLEGLPSGADIVNAKARFALGRWYEDDVCCGFRKYPDRRFFVMGWCGQAAAPGYALPVLAPALGDPPGLHDKAQRALDFLSTAAFHDHGFHTWYDIDAQRWKNVEVLSEGQAMLNLFRALHATPRTGLDGRRWEAFLTQACGLHARRLLDPTWRPASTNEAFLIAPLCAGAARFGDPLLREAALRAGRHYRERHLGMDEPYWGGTLDASCEDKEGAFAALQAFLALFDLTGERPWLAAALHALDVVLTYCVAWDIPLPPGPLADRGLKTRGWTAVSVQNMHLDVFGVVFAPDVYRLGQLTGRSDLQRLARVMFRSCGQLIDPEGSQGEQIEQTNYTQQRTGFGPGGMRGGYSERWTVFWITAHFLTAAAQFAEMGVALD